MVNRSLLLRCSPREVWFPRQGGTSCIAWSKPSSAREHQQFWLSIPFFFDRDNRDWGYPLLTGAGYADSAGMTVEKCAAYCESQPTPYRFMGITDGFQCCMSTSN